VEGNQKNGNGDKWRLTKEKILLALGAVILIGEFVNSEIFQRPYQREYVLAALALCGVAITQWVDKK